MADYKTMYYLLFKEVTEVIEKLQKVQQKTEELYLAAEDVPIVVFKDPDKDK